MYFGQKSLIPIAKLFDWSIKNGWDEFWIQGIKNWQEEVTFYKTLSGLGAEYLSGNARNDAGNHFNPIIVSNNE